MSFVPIRHAVFNAAIYPGRNILWNFTTKDAAGAVISLSDVSSITAKVFDSRTGVEAAITLTAAVVVAASGTWKISATPANTAGYVTTSGTLEVKFTFSDGVEATIIRGAMERFAELVP